MHPNAESKRGAKSPLDCAWCKVEFVHIVELLAHVDERHLAVAAASTAA
jgi:hypothetical protein